MTASTRRFARSWTPTRPASMLASGSPASLARLPPTSAAPRSCSPTGPAPGKSASIPPTADAAFAPALAAGTYNPPRRSWNPADSASRSAGTRPAADTKFGSSKTGRIV